MRKPRIRKLTLQEFLNVIEESDETEPIKSVSIKVLNEIISKEVHVFGRIFCEGTWTDEYGTKWQNHIPLYDLLNSGFDKNFSWSRCTTKKGWEWEGDIENLFEEEFLEYLRKNNIKLYFCGNDVFDGTPYGDYFYEKKI